MYGWSIFWFAMGAVSVLIVVGFRRIANDKGIKMNWWKWAISILWWMGFLFAVAVPLTFMGEGEFRGGALQTLFSVVPATLLGFVVWRVITHDRAVKS